MKIRTKQKNYSTPRKRDEKGKVARRVKSIEKGKFEPDEIADKIADQIADKISSRNVTAQHINQFLPKRPSSDVLIKNHLVQNTMTWNAETVSGKPPSARNCHSATVIGKKMFLTGGYGDHSNKETFIELIDLDLQTMSWEKPFVTGTSPKERYSHCCVAIGTKLVLFGGFSVGGSWLDDLHMIDVADSKKPCDRAKPLVWQRPEAKGTAPCARAAATAVSMDNRIFYFGGNNGVKFFNDVHVLDVEKMEWRCVRTKGTAPSPRAGHTATLMQNDRMVVFGGGVADGYSNDIFVLNLETATWTKPKIIGTAPCPRAGHTAMPILNRTAMLVFGGGFSQKVYGDLHLFDIEMGKWTRPSDAGYLPQARAGHSCVTMSNIAYFFGGADGDSHVFNDVYSLDTAFLLLKNLAPSSVGFELYENKFVDLNLVEKLESKISSLALKTRKSHNNAIQNLKELLRIEENSRKKNEKKFRELKADLAVLRKNFLESEKPAKDRRNKF